ncbi:hypothetical protein D3C78_1015730 [compost metagenome]
MGLGRGARARGQDELLQARQLGVVVRQGIVELQQAFVLEQLVAGNRQFAAQVEQLVLDIDQQRAHVLRQVLAQQQADVRIEFVHVAHGVGPSAVLRNPAVVAQAGGSIVAGAGGDLCQTVAHGCSLNKKMAPTLAHCVWLAAPQGGCFLPWGGPAAKTKSGKHCRLQQAGKCRPRQQQAKMLANQADVRCNAAVFH